MEAMSAGRHLHDCTVRFRTRFVWRTRTTTLNSASESPRRAGGPFTVQTPRWFVGRSSEARRSVHVPSVSSARAAHCTSGSHVYGRNDDGTDYQEVKNSWGTS